MFSFSMHTRESWWKQRILVCYLTSCLALGLAVILVNQITASLSRQPAAARAPRLRAAPQIMSLPVKTNRFCYQQARPLLSVTALAQIENKEKELNLNCAKCYKDDYAGCRAEKMFSSGRRDTELSAPSEYLNVWQCKHQDKCLHWDWPLQAPHSLLFMQQWPFKCVCVCPGKDKHTMMNVKGRDR